jgi:hypothetical protein
MEKISSCEQTNSYTVEKVLNCKKWPTKRVADAGDSVAFLSIFLTSIFPPSKFQHSSYAALTNRQRGFVIIALVKLDPKGLRDL